MIQAYFLLPDHYTFTWICNRQSLMRTIELELNAATVQNKPLRSLTVAWIRMCGSTLVFPTEDPVTLRNDMLLLSEWNISPTEMNRSLSGDTDIRYDSNGVVESFT